MKKIKKMLAALATFLIVGQVLIDPVSVLATEINQEEVSDEQNEEKEQLTETSETDVSEQTDIPQSTNLLDLEDSFGQNQKANDSPDNNLLYGGYTLEGDKIEFGISGLINRMKRDLGNSYGKLTKYYSQTMFISLPYITINGEAAWCVAPDKGFPVNIEYAKQVYNDEGVYNILYYALQNGWDQENENYVDVFVALNIYLGHSYQGVNLNQPVLTSDSNVAFLLEKARVKDAPIGKFDILNKKQTADFDSATKLQKTDWYSPTTDSKNVEYTLTIPKGIGLELSNGKKYGEGTYTLSQDIKFRLTAPANYTGTVKFDVPTNLSKKAALRFDPIGADVQSLVKPGGVTDPIYSKDVQATFFARQGKFKLKKMSEISNLPMSEVGFKVTMSTGEVLELESNENGETPESKDFDFGTTGEVTEVKTPAGYVKLASPIKFTVEAGTTIEVAIENKIQKGEFTFQKFEEVYKPQETWDAGKPMYDRTPAANREFDLVRENDHTLPDGKTIVGKAGEVVDHIVTDKDGNGSSNVELFIGSQNKYKLVETNTPENYRDPSDIQTEFSIPYGNNTEKLVLFDQGEIDNELKTVNLTFNKKNVLDLAGLNLTGAQFLVQGLTNDVKFMFTTESASTLLKLLADKGTATYSFTEVKRPDGFDLVPGTTDTRIVTVTEGKDMTIDWENMPKAQKVGISTQAHTGDGSSQTFVWGEDATFYDDSNLTHENIPTGTKRKKEVKLHALYEDGTSAIVWKSGLVDYTVIDKEMTERTIAEYDYKKDPKATPNTRWYFSEDGYDKDGKKDTEHNPDGKDAKQDIKPILKETQATPKTSTTPTKTGTLPTTGEMIQSTLLMIGLMVVAVAGLLFQKKYELD
jgi:LPXTG-motif cell wall-anchored protein